MSSFDTSRSDYGFARSACACRRSAISCEHVPGALSPADLARMAAHLGYADIAALRGKTCWLAKA